ncbi:hypothetical protein ILYODFUR_036716 [Ilyodon furcidens]|uniref:Uncharacterized protein n=1 Tax=Ilyodon furcidens TaxID=33524 RepID=A0ABV0UY92_9TELE
MPGTGLDVFCSLIPEKETRSYVAASSKNKLPACNVHQKIMWYLFLYRWNFMSAVCCFVQFGSRSVVVEVLLEREEQNRSNTCRLFSGSKPLLFNSKDLG